MSQATATDITGPLTDALASGRLDDADALLTSTDRAVPAEALPAAAELRMAQERWSEAARLLGRIVDRDGPVVMQQRLCLNLAVLQAHRPAVYRAIIDAPPGQPFEIVEGRAADATIAHVSETGRRTLLSPEGDPRAQMGQALDQLRETLERGDAIALCGLGDGYLLNHLSRHPPDLLMTMAQTVWLFEPDARLVLAALMLHDYAGSDGPIEQARIQWFVGPQYVQAFEQALIDDPMLPTPLMNVQHSIDSVSIDAAIQEVASTFNTKAKRLMDQLDAMYAQRDRAEWVALFSDNPPRRPRVLLPTSRFTTVLQHSSRDTADAFEQLGWETRILIEPTDHHRTTKLAARQVLAEFKPDLVFQIDHLRHEWDDVYPPHLPFACWIQDQLPNLLDAKAGAAVTLRDYVLTLVAPMYTDHYDYPMRQMIDVPKLTRVPQRPATWTSDGEDMVYVSNASQTHQQLIDATQQILPEAHWPGAAGIFAQRMIELYDRGGALPTLWHIRVFIQQLADEHGWSLTDDIVVALIRFLNHPVNNALYRQQALSWIAAAAERHGLSLGIYGQGWEDHPEFAAYARGPVGYGQPLEDLTRRSKINLQIVPSICVHQRLLDGLVSGGFFLVRHHASDTILPRVARFLTDHFDDTVNSIEAARSAASADVRDAFETLLQEAECYHHLDQPIDLVQWIRTCQRGQLFDPDGSVLPLIDDVSFDDAASFDDRLGRFIGDDSARREVSDTQRRAIEQRLTYTAGMRRVVQRIGELIDCEPASAESTVTPDR